MGDWIDETSLGGRAVVTIALPPNGATAAPGPRSLVALLQGGAIADGRALAPGDLLAAPGREIRAGAEGARLAAVRWDGEPWAGPVRADSPGGRHFPKYESFQARVRLLGDEGDVLAPFELYRVRMVGGKEDRVQLHVHREVTNLLFVPGPTGARRGWLIVARDGRTTATPLLGGDRAVVRPGIRHHVVPLAGADPVEMIVVNDGPSAYEDVDRSDFHLVETVPWNGIDVEERPDAAPALTVVG